jgi:hypothetical protein
MSSTPNIHALAADKRVRCEVLLWEYMELASEYARSKHWRGETGTLPVVVDFMRNHWLRTCYEGPPVMKTVSNDEYFAIAK